MTSGAMSEPTTAAVPCPEGHHWVTRARGGHRFHVQVCMLCEAIDWDDLDAQLREHEDKIRREAVHDAQCWTQTPGGFTACDRPKNHLGRHSWEAPEEITHRYIPDIGVLCGWCNGEDGVLGPTLGPGAGTWTCDRCERTASVKDLDLVQGPLS